VTRAAMPPPLPAARLGDRIVSQRWVHIRDLIRELVARDLRLRYRGSLLGMAWTLLNPLTELLVLLFIFSTVLRVDIPNYPSYLFTGLLVYEWFQTSLNYATGAIVNNRELIRRPGVPSSILPVVTVASNLVHFLLSLPILFVLLLTSHVQITTAILALPILIAVEFLLILGFAYPVATMHVWFRDTQHVLRLGLQLLFFLTPVFYDASMVPAHFRPIYDLNPLAHMVTAYRAVLLHGEFPDAVTLLSLTALSVVLLIAGVAWFRRASHRFADEV
jgi:homopolymeric O-antigen transport system permease protein